ncbi:HPr(Ser) kinase/phosphatase [Ureaplasma ceti]|uniref:HPr kinase/phosphorylase n=1 Tax=Ureaplasma ceti TaxID=3119530 RepID=A0ABP9UCJ3_9BACT
MAVFNKLYAKQIVEKFDLEVLANGDQLCKREIKFPDIGRAGFELTGEKVFDDFWNIIYLGVKELRYLRKFSQSIVREKIEKILKMKPPMIILGKGFKYDKLVTELAQKTQVPVAKSVMSLQELNFTISTWMTEQLAPHSMYHGCLLNVFGVGTLIIGASGIGKSEITVELVKRGHIFIADDAVMITRVGPKIFGRAEDSVKDFIEIRGLGILSFSRTFGIEKIINSTRIRVVCELIDANNPENKNIMFERLGQEAKFMDIEGVKIPYYKIPVLQGRNTSDLVETAITDWKLKKQGYNSANEFIRQLQTLKEKED